MFGIEFQNCKIFVFYLCRIFIRPKPNMVFFCHFMVLYFFPLRNIKMCLFRSCSPLNSQIIDAIMKMFIFSICERAQLDWNAMHFVQGTTESNPTQPNPTKSNQNLLNCIVRPTHTTFNACGDVYQKHWKHTICRMKFHPFAHVWLFHGNVIVLEYVLSNSGTT